MPEQLPLPLPPFRQSYPEIKGPKCPCCKQYLGLEQSLVVWQSLRAWLILNWDWAARELIRYQSFHPEQLSLREHPDLLWALEADARAHELEVSDRLAEILDSYFQGEFNDILRRSLKKPSWSYAIVQNLVFAHRSDRPWAGKPDKNSVFLGRAESKNRAHRLFQSWIKAQAPLQIRAPETGIGSGYEANQSSEPAKLSQLEGRAAKSLDVLSSDPSCQIMV